MPRYTVTYENRLEMSGIRLAPGAIKMQDASVPVVLYPTDELLGSAYALNRTVRDDGVVAISMWLRLARKLVNPTFEVYLNELETAPNQILLTVSGRLREIRVVEYKV